MDLKTTKKLELFCKEVCPTELYHFVYVCVCVCVCVCVMGDAGVKVSCINVSFGHVTSALA